MDYDYIKQVEDIQWDNLPHNLENKKPFKMSSPKELSESCIVIDNGSYEIRGGYSFLNEPCVSFRSLVAKPKVFGTMQINNVFVVGNNIYNYEQGKVHKKSPFEKNILTHFGTFEHLLDNIFDYLQIKDECVNHPVLITETFANLNFSRKNTSEMLFELYGVPSVCYGVDFLFSLYHNNPSFRNENKDFNSLVISSSFQYTHIASIIDGVLDMNKSKRLNIGSDQARDLLMKSLQLKYPEIKTKFTNEVIQNIQENYTETAFNYEKQLKVIEKLFAEERKKMNELEIVNIYGSLDMYNKVCKSINEDINNKGYKYGYMNKSTLTEAVSKFPYLKTYKNFSAFNNEEYSDDENLLINKLYFFKRPQFIPMHIPTDEEIKLKQEMKKEQSKRLREMMQKKREENLKKLQNELEIIENILQVKEIDKYQFEELLTNNGFNSFDELQKRYAKLLNKLNLNTKDKEDVDVEKRWPLVSIPDDQLTAEQLKLKRIQRMQKNSYLSRLEKKEQAQKEKEKIEELKHNDPEQYIISLFKEKKEILSKLERFRQLRKEMSNRHSKSNIKRMQTLAELGNDSNENSNSISQDDDFGKNDEDWDLYREISKHNLTDEEDEEQQHLHEVEGKIIEMDPDFTKKTEIYQYNYYNTNNSFYIGVDQFRGPELLFKPYIIGVEQAGLTELITKIFKSINSVDTQRNLIGNVFLTGGNLKIRNIKERLAYELREYIPVDMNINISLADDPLLDAWKGGKDFAEDKNNQRFFITKEEYNEQGAHYFKEHCASNKKIHSLGDKREPNEFLNKK
ncbi:MAG: hypothetical protein MJ252_03565 [archaeon]|nr:hypothetical protein [archaeon]